MQSTAQPCNEQPATASCVTLPGHCVTVAVSACLSVISLAVVLSLVLSLSSKPAKIFCPQSDSNQRYLNIRQWRHSTGEEKVLLLLWNGEQSGFHVSSECEAFNIWQSSASTSHHRLGSVVLRHLENGRRTFLLSFSGSSWRHVMKLKQLHSEQNERVNTGHSDSTSLQVMVAVWRESIAAGAKRHRFNSLTNA